jgi:hypothetical protein
MASANMVSISAVMSEYFETERHAQRLEQVELSKAGDGVVSSFGTPETATAALGTAHEVRVRKAEGWAAGRERKKGLGNSRGRQRGKGAQLRRQLRKRQATMDEWRRQQTAVQPVGDIRAEMQRYGCTRLLRQRSEAMLKAEKLEKAAKAITARMVVLEESEKAMCSLYEVDEQRKIRELREKISSLEWSVRHGRESLREAGAAERRLEVRFDDFKKAHAREKKGWQIENERLKEAMRKESAEKADLCADGAVSDAAEAGPGTTRRLAVDRPAPAGAQKRLRMDAAAATMVEAESEAIARVEEAARQERNAAADRLDAVRDELHEMQWFVEQRHPGACAAWIALQKEKPKKEVRQKYWFEE